ncbi:hypothetical protein SAMN05444145_105247 [Alistipes timonensis JC136]|uniref:Baseplate J-like protein n=1 Tax=Alistipes timonensis JC136 TaxID=1033731 RepID=A0A1H4DEK0_9BACT|nr:hypothetical protein [Alistipes timonensis]SEA70870.1 hypothetical protein SAMN05444145_105247 [Alistipes timonensis JC136]
MRTVDEIKQDITSDFMRNESVAALFGFKVGDSFTAHFSKVSVVSVLFYIFACAAFVLERLFDSYRQEVDDRIEAIIPHRPKWYRDRVLAFMKDRTLIPDTDEYDTADMTDEESTAARVVKHAVADESDDASLLTIKVAGEQGGRRCPLDAQTESQLKAYIAEIKDAGVRTSLVNIAPDRFNCELDIYFDPMLLASAVESTCREAIQNYIENLPFNGEYTNMALVDQLQKIDGVRIPELRSATTVAAGESVVTAIDARCVPAAGYFEMGDVKLNMKVYNG